MGDVNLSCYAAPWGSEGAIKAVTEMGECGFGGVEFPAEVVRRFEDRLHVFEEILDTAGLRLSSLYQSLNLVNKEKADEQVERAANSARFAGATGHGNLMVSHGVLMDSPPSEDDWLTVGAILEEIGCRCRDFGINLCFLPRTRHLVDSERDLKRLMEITNPDNVSLGLDTAEITLAGLDPSKLIKTYASRLKSIRFRDASASKKRADATSSRPGSTPQFGRGAVKFEAVTKTLLDIKYDGWITVDVSGESVPPRDAALNAYRFILRRSGLYPY
ncbi:MAG: sugar phosphate isomerase/epimerase [Planctomycetota bacterium]|nr:sugar phosphate isomerase/epimerase [Planctomycetota bacterium]